MRKANIGLDFDNVIGDTDAYFDHFFPIDFAAQQIPQGRASKEALIQPGMLTLDQYRVEQKSLYNNSERSLEFLNPREGAIEALRTLIELGYWNHLGIITARDEISGPIARAILEDNYDIYIPFTLTRHGNPKTEALANYDVYMDDDIGHLTPLVGKNKLLFLMTTPENANLDPGPGIIRLNSWAEFMAYIQSEAFHEFEQTLEES